MPHITYLPDHKTVETDTSRTILQASLEAGIPHTHLCGGKSRCSTCRVLILEGLENCSPRNAREREIARNQHYPPSLRLACQTTVTGDVILRRFVVDQEDIALTSQLVVERVRAEVMAMRSADDFVNIVRVLWEGLHDIGLDVDYCALDVLDEDPNTCETHAVTSSWIETCCGIAPIQRDVAAEGHYYCSHLILDECEQNIVLNRAQVVAAWSPEEERSAYLAFVRRCWRAPDLPDAFLPKSWITVPFSHGRISVHSFEPDRYLPQDFQLIEIFAGAVSLAYTRLLDFRHLEARNQELQEAYRKLQETQTELIHAGKMASLGELVAGVAHEINTPLGAIKSSVDTINRGIERAERLVVGDAQDGQADAGQISRIFRRLADLHGIINQAIGRIEAIVGHLRRFARLDASAMDIIDLHEGIENTLVIVAHELKNRIEIHKEYDRLPPVECYPNQLNQVFMNILVNAAQAIDGQGRITIRTSHQDDHIVLEFSDTGKGIHPPHIARIFDPGFTTKGVGVGMGLGLSIVHQITEKHQGKIEVESEPDHGTTFRLILPVKQS